MSENAELSHFVFSLFHLLFFVFPNASQSRAFCIKMDSPREFPLRLKLFNSDWLPFYHFSEAIDDCPQNELLSSGHILTLNKRTLTAPLPHSGLQIPAAPSRLAERQGAGSEVRKAEVLGNSGAFIMGMI